MPSHELPIIVITQTLADELCLVEALFFPEALRCADEQERAQESLRANLHKLCEELPLVELHQRHPASTPEVGEVILTLDPPTRTSFWRAPVTLHFPVICWQHGQAAQLAYVPALNIEVVATSPATRAALDRKLAEQIQAALVRKTARHSLRRLARLQRCRDLQISQQQIEVALLTPKQTAVRELAREAEQKSALAEAGVELKPASLPVAYEIDGIIASLAEALTGHQARSVLLVGPSGVGKTAAVYELARRRDQFGLGHTPFWETNGSRLIAGMSGFGQWQERCQRLWREAAATRAILYLGNLIELMEVGRYSGNTQGIAGFLRPYIARGDVLAIAECTTEQLPLIERADPRLLQAFQQLKLEEPPAERARNILLEFALAHSGGANIEMESIERTDQLHRRYATYSAYPGRPVRFFKNLLQDRATDAPLTAAEVTTAFSRETGLPRVLLDEREELALAATRAWLAARVIGQSEAVELIIDLLATVKAGLTRPRKPIASLLFIGPTGVGKTEMAKSLAEFLFQDRNRMVRFDMSEYADPDAVNRLVGGASGEGLLTSKVREQPFAVVLLDEFEKAHPLFFDLLLQVLGEGRLTDALGRVADFSNAVVIMTSNLGAQSFQRGLVGFNQAQATRQAASKHFLEAVRKALRPEMFNRIDRIVPFAPLDEATVERIAVRELERIRQRDGLRYRGVTLEIAEGVAQHFARRGYDPRYGARPLKRVIERELLVPLAEQLNQQSSDKPLAAQLWLADESLKLTVQPLRHAPRKPADHPLAEMVRRCQQVRREAQALQTSPTVRTVQNEIYTLERLEKRLARGKWRNPAEAQRLVPLPRLRQAAQALNEFVTGIAALEDEALLTLYGRRAAAQSDLQTRLAQAVNQWPELLLSIYALKFKRTDEITLALFSEEATLLFELASIYYAIAQRHATQVMAYQFTVKHQRPTRAKSKGESKDEPVELERQQIKMISAFLATTHPGVIGLVFGLTGPFVFPLFELERGLHRFRREKRASECLVQASDEAAGDYQPPAGIARQGAIGNQELRRTYHLDQVKLKDATLEAEWEWDGHLNAYVVESLMQESLLKRARALFE